MRILDSQRRRRFASLVQPRLRGCLGSALFLVLVLGAGVPAWAHKGGVERTVLLEPTAEGLEVVVHLEVTGKKRVQVLTVFADQDRDGTWSEREHQRLKASLVDRALSKLVWRLDGKVLALPPPKALLKRGAEGIELLVAWSLPLSVTTHKLQLERAGGDPGHLRLVPAAGRTLALEQAKAPGPLSHLAKRQTVLISAVVAPGSGR